MHDSRTTLAGRAVAVAQVTVRGETLELRADRTLFWPRERWLIVADVHLGKAESLRRDGVALPDAVMDDDLQRLRHAVVSTGADRLLVLGDLVHDAHGMTASLERRVAEWRSALGADVALVPGNHDRRVLRLPSEWHIRALPEVFTVAPFVFSHEQVEVSGDDFNWHGHVHPVRTVRGGGDRVRLPCFGIDAGAGVIPAFSSLTGGCEQWERPGAQHWVIVDGQLIALPAR